MEAAGRSLGPTGGIHSAQAGPVPPTAGRRPRPLWGPEQMSNQFEEHFEKHSTLVRARTNDDRDWTET